MYVANIFNFNFLWYENDFITQNTTSIVAYFGSPNNKQTIYTFSQNCNVVGPFVWMIAPPTLMVVTPAPSVDTMIDGVVPTEDVLR